MFPVLFNARFPDPALRYTKKVIALGPIQYLPHAEPVGATVALDESGNGRTGAYTAVTLGAVGIGDGRPAASFDGSTSYNNIYTASLGGAFNGAEGSVCVWAKYLGSWTDATNRTIVRYQVNGSNYIILMRATANNQLDLRYNAAATLKQVLPTVGPTTAWIHVGVTWSASADQAKFYINGAQSGATQTGLGIFAGALSSTLTIAGASSLTPTQVWNGTIAHIAAFNYALTAAQVASLAVV